MSFVGRETDTNSQQRRPLGGEPSSETSVKAKPRVPRGG